MRLPALTFLALGALAAGCPSAPSTPTDGGGLRPCTNDLECDDGFACTRELCGAGGRCEYTPLDARCAAGETCRIGVGCTSEVRCTSTAECNDGIDCTLDSCALGGVCRNDPESSLCGGATPFCDRLVGCTAGGDAGPPTGCTSSAECNDGVACTIDSCDVSGRCANAPMDALCGTGETCNPTTGCFTPMPCTTDGDCDDGVFCNGRERCQSEFGCVPPTAPATCDDSEACTVDRCDATADMCVFECNTAMMTACASHPACAAPTATCEGRFRLVAVDPSVLAQTCASGMVDFDYAEVTFTNVGPGLALTAAPAGGRGPALSDSTAPVCPMIDARAGVTGMCPEQYILRGTFTDENTFVGTFQFNGGGGVCDLLSGCRSATTNVTGTRL